MVEFATVSVRRSAGRLLTQRMQDESRDNEAYATFFPHRALLLLSLRFVQRLLAEPIWRLVL